jgi:hypothetical protein
MNTCTGFDGPEVPLGLAVCAQRLQACLVQLLEAVWDLHQDDVSGVEQALQVLGQSEHCRAPVRRLVSADPFEDAHAIMQRMSEHVHPGVFPVHELPVEPDLVCLLHGAPT